MVVVSKETAEEEEREDEEKLRAEEVAHEKGRTEAGEGRPGTGEGRTEGRTEAASVHRRLDSQFCLIPICELREKDKKSRTFKSKMTHFY